MLQIGLLIVCAFSATQARLWQNPVLDGGDYPDPGVIIVDGVYYAATTTNNDKGEKYPIHSSTDLQNWKLEGYIFNQSNFPSYSRTNFEFWAPELHKVGNEYRAYFTTRDIVTNLLTIGVATAPTVLGPYKVLDRPLVSDLTGDVLDATLIQNNGSLTLVWRGHLSLWARNLTADGLSFRDNTTLEIMRNDIDWEGTTVEGPWSVVHNGYYYLFYSGNNFCSEQYVVGVARSRVSPIGPFEKLPNPILVSNDIFKGLGHGSVVRDTDGEGWVFIYHGWRTGQVCGSNFRLMFTSSVEWGDDDWPKNIVI